MLTQVLGQVTKLSVGSVGASKPFWLFVLSTVGSWYCVTKVLVRAAMFCTPGSVCPISYLFPRGYCLLDLRWNQCCG